MATPLIETLESLDAAASPGPWYVRHLTDDVCMSAVAISTVPADETITCDWPEGEMVAACLIQYPEYVVPADKRWNENAELIVALRNALPELLRLARIGHAAERGE